MTEMTQHEAVSRAWRAAERAAIIAAGTPERADVWAAVAQAWAAVAAQLPFEQPEADVEQAAVVLPMPVPRPLERRDDPTNVRTPAELEHEAARAALRGEPVPDPRADETAVLSQPQPNTAIPRPGSIERGGDGDQNARAVCMCGVQLVFRPGWGWSHANGGPVCPS